ncbi:hypothetical protein [Pajaroellobacter abortibovis]|uniref:hypothetical protein n=1 Tax=Pajaroellobacter abortibovis TaxID=1882918 RepID=UPI0012EBD1E2|nr:hypothetical protein [Pajaroellobacter abortibovis]
MKRGISQLQFLENIEVKVIHENDRYQKSSLLGEHALVIAEGRLIKSGVISGLL